MSTKAVKALIERFGVDLQEASFAIIETYAPFSRLLLNPLLGLSLEQYPKYLKPEDFAWVEEIHREIALVSAFEQLIQLSRYGSNTAELCTTLIQRTRKHPPLKTIKEKFNTLENQWISAVLIRVVDHLPSPAPIPKSTAKILKEIFSLVRKATENMIEKDWRKREKLITAFSTLLRGEWANFLSQYDDFFQQDLEELASVKDFSYLIIAFIHGRYAQAWSYLQAMQADRLERQMMGEDISDLDLIDDFLVEINLSLEKIPSLFLRYPLVHGMKLGNREWQLDEMLGDETWHCSDEMGNEGVLEEIWPIGQASWIDQTQREAFELSQLRHDHLSQILDWGIDPSSGRWFLVYPYVKGVSFLNKLQERAMSEAEIRSFFIQIASALEMCAKRGVFHRQIRLENLFLVSDEKAIITRFGIHRGQFPAWKWSFDVSSFRKKTYAPELFENGSFGQPSDIYSFAVCMAICLFPEAEHLPKISDFPKVFQPFFKKALQLEATQRFLDWTSVLEALREIKPVYQYRNLSALKNDPFGENLENQSNVQSYSLLEVVALILENPDDPHEIWQTNFGKDWKSWQSVDEVEQLVLAAIQKEKERQTKKLQKEQEEKEKAQEKEKEREKIRQYLQNEHRHKNLSQEEEGQKERSSKANLLVRNHFAKDGVIKKKTAFLNHQLYSTPQPAGSLHLIPNGDLTLNFCYVPIGEFLMGSPNLPTTPQLERPMHLVSFTRPFLLFQTPVTQALFEMVMGYNPSYFYGKSRPVEQVSWFEAAAFCNRLSQREGLVPAYFFSEKLDHIAIMADSDGYRLPTEAEWEYAAKAGQIFDFSGSPSFEEIAWFEENSQGQTQAVAQKKPNAWGLYDMSGNVAEWCHDGLRRYNKACQDPVWDTSEEAFYPLMRAIKGGSWRKPSALGKVSSRAQHMSIYKRKYLGFRIIRPLLPVLFSYDQE